MVDTPYKDYRIHKKYFDVVIVGSGAAGYNAANRLYDKNIKNIAIVTECKNLGTSRNSGSDKQTYYKLSLDGDEDSIYDMAKVLYSGYETDGDIALVESSESVRSFMNLVELGVDFPTNVYGSYIGYKTDHDPNKRGTTAGPYTSKQMTEKLEAKAVSNNINILDHFKLIKIINYKDKFNSILCLHRQQYYLIFAKNLILATGGPANLYENKVYPYGQKGATGIALESGIIGKNLTHFQYGLASKYPKWNVSGTYMQSLPSIYSLDDKGNKVFFLDEYFKNREIMLKNIFLKGYQWPFDLAKIKGSSIIDFLVYRQEVELNRKVYLDFRINPGNKDIDFSRLDDETFNYLNSNDALLKLPIDRLIMMNLKAYEFYLDKNVDLKKEPLEISLCVQHNNGGLGVDINFETNIKNIYAVGEVAGTHGIYRPGGSALNAGQVGSFRAASNISISEETIIDEEYSYKQSYEFISKIEKTKSNNSNIKELIAKYQKEMTKYCACFRNLKMIPKLIDQRKYMLDNFGDIVKYVDNQIIYVYEFYNILIAQIVYLEAMLDYSNKNITNIGGAVYYNDNLDIDKIKNVKFINKIQNCKFDGLNTSFIWREVKDIPVNNESFEKEWKKFIDRKN